MTDLKPVKVDKWSPDHRKQESTSKAGWTWLVTDVIAKAEELPVIEVPLQHMYIDYKLGKMPIRNFVEHMKNVMDADLDCPIIADYDGVLFDGRHRLAKALYEGRTTVKMKRFEDYLPPSFRK